MNQIVSACMDILYHYFSELTRLGYLPQAFEHPFMVRGLIAALIIGPLLGGMGVMVVTRKLAFFTQTVGHASLTGVAIGLLLGEPLGETYAGLYGFSLLIATLILYLRNRTHTSSDTIVGVVLAQSLGLGIVMLVLVTKQFDVHQVEAMLFGSLLTVTEQDLLIIAIVGLLAAMILTRIFNPFMLVCFNRSLASTRGAKPTAVEYIFVLTVTVVVVASLKLIGALLVLALIVVPAAAAQNLSVSLTPFFWSSVGIATVSTVLGLIASGIWPLPTGAAIVLVASLLFYLSLAMRPLVRRLP